MTVRRFDLGLLRAIELEGGTSTERDRGHEQLFHGGIPGHVDFAGQVAAAGQ